MIEKPYPADFWVLYDMARARAEASPLWNTAAMEIEYAVDQSGISEDLEEKIFVGYQEQWTLIAAEIFKLMKSCP